MMKILLKLLFKILWDPKKDFDLALENLALRQQLAAMKRSIKRPRLRCRDRLFWILLSRFWSQLAGSFDHCQTKDRRCLGIKKEFKLFWQFKSRRKGPGRPLVSPEISDLIPKMAQDGEGQSDLGRPEFTASCSRWESKSPSNRFPI